MKYIKNLSNHNAYSAFIVGSDFNSIQTEQKASVSYCKNEHHIHYNPYIPPKANLLDILYSDANNNLSFTSEVLPVSKGKTPIGLCVAATDFFGTGEKARWMSLKYMDCDNPDTGSLNKQAMCFGKNQIDIPTINNIQITHNDGSFYGFLTDFGTNSSPLIPSLFDENNEWNTSVLGEVNQYAVTDIDGKNKTNLILATTIDQTTWQTDNSIINTSDPNYAPAICCCWRYHTLGTNQGDWYLGACGEMCMLLANKTEINTKLAAINTIYPNNCINTLFNEGYWTSTEYNDNAVYYIDMNTGFISWPDKDGSFFTIALLQY